MPSYDLRDFIEKMNAGFRLVYVSETGQLALVFGTDGMRLFSGNPQATIEYIVKAMEERKAAEAAMPALQPEIEAALADEEKAQLEYTALAAKAAPEFQGTLRTIAQDEGRHQALLGEILRRIMGR